MHTSGGVIPSELCIARNIKLLLRNLSDIYKHISGIWPSEKHGRLPTPSVFLHKNKKPLDLANFEGPKAINKQNIKTQFRRVIVNIETNNFWPQCVCQ